MISTLPKLRSDLDRRVQITPNGSALVIKDPLSGQFFRLQQAERFIADQLDGATPLNVLNTRVEKEFGASLAPERKKQSDKLHREMWNDMGVKDSTLDVAKAIADYASS